MDKISAVESKQRSNRVGRSFFIVDQKLYFKLAMKLRGAP